MGVRDPTLVIKLIERNPERLGNTGAGRLARPGIGTLHVRVGRLPHLKTRGHFRLGDPKVLPPRPDQAPSVLDLKADHVMGHRLPAGMRGLLPVSAMYSS